jgi:hypothetical protein
VVLLAPLAIALASGRRGAEAAGARCWIDKGAVVAAASFGDIAGDFLIDLSAPTSALHVTRAQEDGLDGPAARGDLVLAGRHIVGVTLPIADLDPRTARFDTTINGVIGVDLLRRFIVEIDPSPCRLRLLRRPLRPWSGADRLAVREAGGRPLAAARVTDGTRVRAGVFAIDTADWETALTGARLSRPQSADAPAPVRLRAVEVGGRLVEQAPARVQPPPEAASGDAVEGAATADGAIGMAVWSRWRLRVDFRGGWLDLAPADTPARASPRERE